MPSQTALAMSLASARVGRARVTMLSSICVAVITGTILRRAAWMMRLCQTGTFSAPTSTPRSPRATMTPSAAANDRVQLLEGMGVLDLGDDPDSGCARLKLAAHEPNIADVAYERHRQIVEPLLDGEGDVGAVLVRERRQAQRHARHVHPCTAREQTATPHLRVDQGVAAADHFELDLPIAEEDAIAGPNVHRQALGSRSR